MAIDNVFASSKDPVGLLAGLKASQAKIDDFASKISSAVHGDGETLVTAARAAIASNDASKMETPAINSAATNVNNYCGLPS